MKKPIISHDTRALMAAIIASAHTGHTDSDIVAREVNYLIDALGYEVERNTIEHYPLDPHDDL